MPAFSSTIRTVPGGNADGPTPADGPLLTGGSSVREPPTSAATTTTTTRASAPSPTSRPVRLPVRGGPSLVISSSSDSQRGSAGSGIVPSSTPGPAGVVTSDQAAPFHHRAVPGAPSGSGYQPGGDGAVMRSR